MAGGQEARWSSCELEFRDGWEVVGCLVLFWQVVLEELLQVVTLQLIDLVVVEEASL